MKNSKKLNSPIRAPISVVIPCYQAEKTLTRAINSIFNQTIQVSEIILINDGSFDKTLSIANKLTSTHKNIIRLISFNSNKGVSVARNAGWNAASYEYIAFLDAVDTWHPKKIEIQYNFLLSNPNCWLVGHQHQIQKNKAKNIDDYPLKILKTVRLTKLRMLLFTPFATPTVILKRDIPNRFNPNFKVAEDYLLWLQIVYSGREARKILMPLAKTYKYNYGQAGLSRDLIYNEKSVHQVYKLLFQDKLISKLLLAFLIFYSTLKFLLRALFLFYRKVFNA